MTGGGGRSRGILWSGSRSERWRGARSAQKECAERLFIVSLSQIGGSRVKNLGHPAHLRSKDTGDHNLPEKRGQARSASRTPRKTRVVRSRLDGFKSNPDRDKCSPAALLTQRGVTACHAFVFCARQARAVRDREMIPGVGMSGRPNPCSHVRASCYSMSYPSCNEEVLRQRTWVSRLTEPSKGGGTTACRKSGGRRDQLAERSARPA
jgi:hypothetical protein